MKYLLDTSAIINIVQEQGRHAVELIRDQCTLDLAFYECGNVIRTLAHRKEITRADALQLARAIGGAWSLMHVVASTVDEMDGILLLAIEKELAYYDAAFMFHASKLDLVLVTDDKPFQRKVNSSVAWMDSARLIATGGVIEPAGDERRKRGDHGRAP